MEKKYTQNMIRLLTATWGESSSRNDTSVAVTIDTSTVVVRKPSQGR